MAKKQKKARKSTPTRRPHAPRRPAAEITRDDQYAALCREAIKHGETDQLVRHLMAAGLAAGRTSSTVLAGDLTLLRWVLRKMESNRRDAELEAEAERVARG